jgi:uracil-DNA glycosylase
VSVGDAAASGPFAAALAAFLEREAAGGWRDLAFFREGAAAQVAARLDARAAEGAVILPAPGQLFRALELTPPPAVRAVILGQDPYPTPGDAHGLAFSYVGSSRLPASLKRIFAELADDLGAPRRTSGDLTPWARQGVLLLNAALSVEAGRAGAHARLGWQTLTDEVVRVIAAGPQPVAFILWGDKARAAAPLIGSRHLVIASSHPSPLAARGDFLGSRPFSRANAFLSQAGRGSIDWNAPE